MGIARAELDALRKQLEELVGRLQVLENTLVSQAAMPVLLEEMIGKLQGCACSA